MPLPLGVPAFGAAEQVAADSQRRASCSDPLLEQVLESDSPAHWELLPLAVTQNSREALCAQMELRA